MNKNTHLTLSILEPELLDLCVIAERLAEFAEPFETAEQVDTCKMNEGLAGIAMALNPDLSDDEARECAQIGILTLATNKVCRKLQWILSAVKLSQGAPKIEGGLTADEIIEWGKKAGQIREFTQDDREEFLKIVPWSLKTAVDYIASSGIYQKDPHSNTAVGLRMMAVILSRMEELGFSFDEPEYKEVQS